MAFIAGAATIFYIIGAVITAAFIVVVIYCLVLKIRLYKIAIKALTKYTDRRY